MTDIIIIGILLIVVGGAVFYIVKAKKNGAKCVGCPASGTCGKKCCNCESQSNKK